MATDKLINHSQGESIISQLGDIATSLENVTTLSPAKFGMGYAVCDTAAGTAAKTATIANYRATEGALVTVKFTNGNTAANATLNLNSLGAVPILYKGSAIATDIIGVGDTCTFVYSTANSGSYTIINTDTLSGAGAGTVTSVGATGGIITDQSGGAAINSTGSVKLNLKSNTAYTGTVSDPATTDKIYPVALDGDGHPCVGVPWTDTTYTQASNSAISVDNTNHTIDVAVGAVGTKGVVELSTSIPATGAVDTKVATEKAVADSISNKAISTNSSTTNAIATFAGTDGKTLADSAVTIAKNATGVTDDDTKVPTSKAVKTYVDATATGISRYIGTITAANQLSTTAKKGDFYIVSTAWTGVHAGDEIIAEKDNPAKTIDGTNWTLLHNEADTNTTYEFAEGTTNGKFTVTPSDTGTAQSVTVHGLAASAYKGVDTTPTASSSNLVESGGVATALGNKQDTLTFDGTYNASTNKAATVSTVTNAINALDATGTNAFGAGKTISAWSETDGKVSISSQDISITGSQISDIDTTMPTTAVDTKVPSTKLVKTQLSGKQDTLTFDGTYNASTNKAATVSTVTNAINALDVTEVSVGSTKTINKISQTDGKILVTTTDIQSASTSQKGLVQLNDSLDSTSTALAATANAVKAVNDKAETNKSNILLVGKQIDAITNALSASDFTWTLGKVISSYGVIVDDAPYGAITDAMNIDSATAITAPSFSYQDNPINCMVIQYNANNEMVGVRANAAGDVVELLDTATYFRLSFQFGSTSGVTVTQEIINSVFKCNLLYSTENTANAVVELVDDGAKNVFTPTSAITGDAAITVVDNGDGSYNVTGGSNETIRKYVTFNIPTTGDYVLSGCPNTGSNDTYRLDLRSSGGTVLAVDYGSGSTPIHLTAGTGYQLSFRFNANYTAPTTGLTFKPMICTEADWKVSKNYVPYALPNYDLTQLQSEDRAALADAVDEGAKNEFKFGEFTDGGTGASITISGQSVTVTNSSAWAKAWRTFRITKNTTYVLSFRVTNVATVANPYYRVSLGNNHHSGGSYYGIIACNTTGSYYMKFTAPTDTDIYFVLNTNYNSTAASDAPSMTVDNIMVCTEADWNVSQNYAPFALPNTDLTVLEAEDRAALAEVVDSGAKNLYKYDIETIKSFNNTFTWNNNVGTSPDNHITITLKSDNTIQVVSDGSNAQVEFKIGSNTVTALTTGANYVLSGCPSGGSATKYDQRLVFVTSPQTYIQDYGSGESFTCPNAGYTHTIVIRANQSLNAIFKPMVCTEADWKISPKFVPHRPSYDLVSALAQNGGFIDSALGSIIANADLNSIDKTTFAVYNEPANLPSGITGYCYVRTSVFDENSALQELYVIQPNPVSFFRIKLNNSWTVWVQTSNV